jgi:hypothetical protein
MRKILYREARQEKIKILRILRVLGGQFTVMA